MSNKPTMPDQLLRENGPLFSLGRMVATPAAIAEMDLANIPPFELFARHQRGDWGCVGTEDQKLNWEALKDGSRIFSAYILPTSFRLWVITTATDDDGKRESTCILTPDEY